MKHKILINCILAIGILSGLAGCSPNLRDIKASQLTSEQEDKVIKTLTREEVRLLENYHIRIAIEQMGSTLVGIADAFSSVFSEVTPNEKNAKTPDSNQNKSKSATKDLDLDLSINEMIKKQREYESSK